MSTVRRATTCAIVLIAYVAHAHADELADAHRPVLRGEILTGVGTGAALAGLGLVTIGFVLPSCAFALGAPEQEPCGGAGNGTGHEKAATALVFTGIAVSCAGDLLWIAGATEWSIGAHRVKRLQRSSR